MPESLHARFALWKGMIYWLWALLFFSWQFVVVGFYPAVSHDSQSSGNYWYVWLVGDLLILLLASLDGCYRKHVQLLAQTVANLNVEHDIRIEAIEDRHRATLAQAFAQVKELESQLAGADVKQRAAERMREDWNRRAQENARHYVQNAVRDWDDREFFRSGEINVANEVMTDMVRICGGARSPLDLHMLEIGCGVGRMTHALARLFGSVTAIDISDEMIRQAGENLAGFQNVSLMIGDGCSLKGLDSAQFDFAFSFIVFQHIPSRDVISSYCEEVFRVLKPGSLFKVQVQGYTAEALESSDTWLGVPFSESDAAQLAEQSGFQLELSRGAGTQYFWLWLRKPADIQP